MKCFKRIVGQGGYVLILVLLFLPIVSYSAAPEQQRVRLQLKWFHQFQFAGYYAAKEKGYYREAGLDVEILEGGPDIDVLESVENGRAEFGVLGSELAFHKTQDHDVVVLAPMIQHSVRAIIAREDRGIYTPHDLAGKTLMLNTNELPEFAAMFLNEGMDIGDLNVLAKDGTANEQFIRGSVDAINGSVANQPFLFSQKNIGITLLRPVNYGIDFYGDTLFTRSAMVTEHREMTDLFLKASIRGWQYAFDHPEELADLIYRDYSKQKSKAALMFEQARLRELCHPDLVEVGHNNPKRWQHILDVYKQLGLVPTQASLKGFLYQEYLDADKRWIKKLFWVALAVLAGAAVVFFWNLRLRRAVRKMTAEILESRERIRITLDAIGDGVIATDNNGCVTRMNPMAEHLTGWSLDQARGLPLSRVFHIINARTRQPVENPVSQVLAEGRIVELANHTVLVAKDGVARQIADSGAPIKNPDGQIVGVVLVFRDMTEEYNALEQLRQNERKFRSYMEGAPYGIFILDAAGRTVEVNPAMERIFGISSDAFQGMDLTELLKRPAPPDSSPDTGPDELSFSQAMETGRSHGMASFTDGYHREKTCELDLVKLGPDRVLGFAHDITQRKIIEARAIDLARFPSENPNPVLRVDASGRIRYANRGSGELLAFWQTRAGGAVPPVWQARISSAIQQKKIEQYEETFKDICLSLVVTPVEASGYANIYGMDISEHYRTRGLLQKSEEKYRELVEGSQDLIISINGRGVILFVNRVAEQILGISAQEAQGTLIFGFIHPDDRARTRAWVEACTRDRIAVSQLENRLVNPRTGDGFTVLWTSNFHYDALGRIKTVNSVARDLTAQKALEAEKQVIEENLRQALKMEAVGNVAGGIAHDFNNILGIIIGNAELATEDIPEWNPARRNLEEIRIAGLRASEVVKQLLSFSRKSEQFTKIMTIQPIIKESVSLLRASIPTSIDIRVDLQKETGPIEADPTQIHQILINLCTNASHAMEQDGGILGIRLSEVLLDETGADEYGGIPPGAYAELAISDTGHGIDPAILSKIFDPYFTTKKVGKGTGMGLAVVHGIVRSFNGGIRVKSVMGQGSTFIIVFPVTREPVSDAAPQSPEKVLTGHGRILLVDDEAALLDLGKRQLESLGYQVDACQDPVEALAVFEADPLGFCLVVTDMTMPRLTGDQFTENVLKIRPEMPVILCTGYSSKIDPQRSLSIGVKGYVEKPFSRTELAWAVNNALHS